MRKIDQLTFTRFLAAMAIVVYHYGNKTPPFNNTSVATIFQQANIGVSYFFILSGFVMIYAYKRGTAAIEPGRYYINRVARIYPTYLIGLGLVVVYNLLRHFEVDPATLFLSLLGLQAWVPQKVMGLNTPGWSISVEFLFYAVFPPLLNLFYRRLPLRKLVAPIALFWVASQILFNMGIHASFYQGHPSPIHNFFFYFPLLHLNEFLVGNLAGIFFLGLGARHYRNYDLHILALVAATFFLMNVHLPWNTHNGLMALLFVPLVLLLSLNTGRITRVFSNKYLVYLGEISYGVYILQFPVFLYCDGLFKTIGIHNPATDFYPYVLILLVASTLTYKFVEAPMRERIKKLGGKKKAPTPAKTSIELVPEGKPGVVETGR